MSKAADVRSREPGLPLWKNQIVHPQMVHDKDTYSMSNIIHTVDIFHMFSHTIECGRVCVALSAQVKIIR